MDLSDTNTQREKSPMVWKPNIRQLQIKGNQDKRKKVFFEQSYGNYLFQTSYLPSDDVGVAGDLD